MKGVGFTAYRGYFRDNGKANGNYYLGLRVIIGLPKIRCIL